MPLPLALERPEKERGFSAPLLERKHFDIKRESIMIMFGSFLPGLFGWLAPPKFTRVLGADIVMESIALIDRGFEC
jgi:hypothetical protein